jgi:hypothetical protein
MVIWLELMVGLMFDDVRRRHFGSSFVAPLSQAKHERVSQSRLYVSLAVSQLRALLKSLVFFSNFASIQCLRRSRSEIAISTMEKQEAF